ncbi:unnamed protein product [Blepharisma stoltei]|uniref:Uncharacterized protein n=1 Tax=Blepharisma stoltei TaxID=1481888 RepID=A0AAU9JGY6_9CILI|nr:unnamed protein product [Blepharisma stoltei]
MTPAAAALQANISAMATVFHVIALVLTVTPILEIARLALILLQEWQSLSLTQRNANVSDPNSLSPINALVPQALIIQAALVRHVVTTVKSVPISQDNVAPANLQGWLLTQMTQRNASAKLANI